MNKIFVIIIVLVSILFSSCNYNALTVNETDDLSLEVIDIVENDISDNSEKSIINDTESKDNTDNQEETVLEEETEEIAEDIFETKNDVESSEESAVNEVLEEENNNSEKIEETVLEKESKKEEKEEKEEIVLIPDSFDADYYASKNTDVVAVYGNSPEAMYKHYLNYGKKEGRAQNASEEEVKTTAYQEEQNSQSQSQQNPQQLVTASGQVYDYIIIDEKPLSNDPIYEVVCDEGMLILINAYRAENGLAELSWNAEAEQIAKDRINAIAEGGVLSHEAAGGPPAGYVAENLFRASSGGFSSQFIFDGYKSSAGHDANMRNANATSCVIATCNVYKEISEGYRVYFGQWNIQIFY